jgi:uncharacterized damage-inducible protein DinB
MSEVRRIGQLLKHGYDGQPWYGKALRKLLAEVTAEHAAARPIAGAHSIWQEVLHAIAWRRVACRLLRGETVGELSDAENWPEPPGSDEAAWQQTLDELAQTQHDLEAGLANLTDERLQENVTYHKPFPLYRLLHGIIHHDAYHAGQIALLRNAGR